MQPIVSILPEEVQGVVQQACNFRADLAGIAQLMALFGGPTVPDIANIVANVICGELKTQRMATAPGAMGARMIVVRGVTVTGRYVRR